jgi:hypothetical protein
VGSDADADAAALLPVAHDVDVVLKQIEVMGWEQAITIESSEEEEEEQEEEEEEEEEEKEQTQAEAKKSQEEQEGSVGEQVDGKEKEEEEQMNHDDLAEEGRGQFEQQHAAASQLSSGAQITRESEKYSSAAESPAVCSLAVAAAGIGLESLGADGGGAARAACDEENVAAREHAVVSTDSQVMCDV